MDTHHSPAADTAADAGAPTEERMLSLTEVAEIQGVHYMTVYRHVRTGKLSATKHNGEWRVPEAELSKAPSPSTGKPGHADIAARQGAFRNRLLAADEPGAWSILENCMAAGAAPVDLHHDLIIPTMTAVGSDWANGDLRTMNEHAVSAVMQRLIARVGPLLRTKGRRRGAIVVGAVAGDHHSMPIAIIADLLRNSGYDVLDLGANTPASSFVETIRATDRCRAVGLSASTSLDDAIRDTVIAERAEDATLTIVVGGRGIHGAEHAQELGADGTEHDSRLIAPTFERLIAAPDEAEIIQR